MTYLSGDYFRKKKKIFFLKTKNDKSLSVFFLVCKVFCYVFCQNNKKKKKFFFLKTKNDKSLSFFLVCKVLCYLYSVSMGKVDFPVFTKLARTIAACCGESSTTCGFCGFITMVRKLMDDCWGMRLPLLSWRLCCLTCSWPIKCSECASMASSVI